ncbi:hypothetical protein GOBAR_DD17505 [Gossypium barbadense]|nr:hypothetical protein GOBAR_DD17505 [Gossypium barbadense]
MYDVFGIVRCLLTIRGIDIDLNAAPETNVVDDNVYNSSDPSDYEVDIDSDPDVDEVPDDIGDEGRTIMECHMNTPFRQWLGTMEPWQWAQSFDEGFRYGHMTTNLAEGVNFVLMKTQHLPISSVFSATFYRLATLMLRMGQHQVNQMEAGHVLVEDVRDAMVANRQMARSMNVEVYSQRNEKFRVTETIGRQLGHVTVTGILTQYKKWYLL